MRDRFGNMIDQVVGYAHGAVLKGALEEATKTWRGRQLIKRLLLKAGRGHVYNLTGETRSAPFGREDLRGMASQVSYYARLDGSLEDVALGFMGGEPDAHGVVALNRITAAMIAIMLSTIKRGDTVISVTADGPAHPSIARAVNLVGGNCIDSPSGVDHLERFLSQHKKTRLVAITWITPRSRMLPVDDVRRAIKIGKEYGKIILLDDAQMALRLALEQPKPLELRPDIAVFSTDKHMFGPRCGIVAGDKNVVAKIRSKAFLAGMEAQIPLYVAALRSIVQHRPEKVKRSIRLARPLLARMRRLYGDKVYDAIDGVCMSEEDLLGLAMDGRRKPPRIAPVDAGAYHAFVLLRKYGMVTVPIIGAPGATPNPRLQLFPEGGELSVDTFMEAMECGIRETSKVADDIREVRRVLLGN